MSLIEYVGDSEDEIDNVSRIYWAPPLPDLIDARLSSVDVGALEALSSRILPYQQTALIEYVGDSEEEEDHVSRIYWAPPLPILADPRIWSMNIGKREPSSSHVPDHPSKRRRVLSPSPTRNPSSPKTLKTAPSARIILTASSYKARVAASSPKKVAVSSFDTNIDKANTRKRNSTMALNVRPPRKPKKSNLERRSKAKPR